MILDIVRDNPGFAALALCWDALLEQSATRSPFLRWDWMRLWWEEFQSDYELAIGVVRDADGTPLAIAPLMIGSDEDGMRRHLRHIGFLAGLGEVKGERMDFLVPKGREAELTPLLCEVFHRLKGEWQAVRLNKLPAESPNVPWIEEALSQRFAGTGVMTRAPCFCIQLPATLAELEAQMPTKRRRELTRKRERFAAAHPVETGLATPEDAGGLLEEFARLHALHFPEGVSSFLRPASWRFHKKLALQWIAEGRAMLPYIRADGKMVGGIYGFVEGDEFFFFQLGWNPEFANYSMGHLCIRWAVGCSIDRQLRLYDMLPGIYRYKSDWAQTSREVLDIEAYEPDSLRAALFRSARQIKRLLPRPPSAS